LVALLVVLAVSAMNEHSKSWVKPPFPHPKKKEKRHNIKMSFENYFSCLFIFNLKKNQFIKPSLDSLNIKANVFFLNHSIRFSLKKILVLFEKNDFLQVPFFPG